MQSQLVLTNGAHILFTCKWFCISYQIKVNNKSLDIQQQQPHKQTLVYTSKSDCDRFTVMSPKIPTTVGCCNCEDVRLTSGHCPSWACVTVISHILECVDIPTQVIGARDIDRVGVDHFTHVQWRLIPSDVELLSWNGKCHRWCPWGSWRGWEYCELWECSG